MNVALHVYLLPLRKQVLNTVKLKKFTYKGLTHVKDTPFKDTYYENTSNPVAHIFQRFLNCLI